MLQDGSKHGSMAFKKEVRIAGKGPSITSGSDHSTMGAVDTRSRHRGVDMSCSPHPYVIPGWSIMGAIMVTGAITAAFQALDKPSMSLLYTSACQRCRSHLSCQDNVVLVPGAARLPSTSSGPASPGTRMRRHRKKLTLAWLVGMQEPWYLCSRRVWPCVGLSGSQQ